MFCDPTGNETAKAACVHHAVMTRKTAVSRFRRHRVNHRKNRSGRRDQPAPATMAFLNKDPLTGLHLRLGPLHDGQQLTPVRAHDVFRGGLAFDLLLDKRADKRTRDRTADAGKDLTDAIPEPSARNPACKPAEQLPGLVAFQRVAFLDLDEAHILDDAPGGLHGLADRAAGMHVGADLAGASRQGKRSRYQGREKDGGQVSGPHGELHFRHAESPRVHPSYHEALLVFRRWPC